MKSQINLEIIPDSYLCLKSMKSSAVSCHFYVLMLIIVKVSVENNFKSFFTYGTICQLSNYINIHYFQVIISKKGFSKIETKGKKERICLHNLD